ncbi:MAG: hypothetical protein CVV09_17910 [Gammaproteobacteria bacterium HGW-Gammaproteobacteria-13]|nr:MAG: hypothetical protein CVV09_17910 [Gammaproteobacteria bacterium HGW-Gammaproteobacteria-13]
MINTLKPEPANMVNNVIDVFILRSTGRKTAYLSVMSNSARKVCRNLNRITEILIICKQFIRRNGNIKADNLLAYFILDNPLIICKT